MKGAMVSKRHMTAFTRALGERIAALRVQAGLTQDALAERLDSASSGVSRIENGGSLPSVTRLVEIAEVLRVEVRELFTFSTADRSIDDRAESAARRIATLLRLVPPSDVELIISVVEVLARRLRK